MNTIKKKLKIFNYDSAININDRIQVALSNLRATSLNKYAIYDNSRNTSSIYLFSIGHNNPASDMAVVCLHPRSIELFYLPHNGLQLLHFTAHLTFLESQIIKQYNLLMRNL